MLHIAKLAVGVRDVAHLRAIQAARVATDAPLRHYTRSVPRRAVEIAAGGSIYWVVAGAMIVRQRVLQVTEDRWEDGTRCAALELDPALVQVLGRPTKAFQGWRYLSPEDAPADLEAGAAVEDGELPAALRAQLRALCLL